MNRPPPRFTKVHADQLAAHDWPGNVRELQNAVERALILSQSGPLGFELVAAKSTESPRSKASASEPTILTRDQLKCHVRASIIAALNQSGGKVFGAGGAAELLGMKPTTLSSRIKALGLSRKGNAIILNAMPYDELLEQRVRLFLDAKRIRHEAKRMMGGLCFMVKGKMCVAVEINRLMARIGPEAYDDALTRQGCCPMDFTGRPMRGFVFGDVEGLKSDKELAFWLELALAYNPTGKRKCDPARQF